jgi:hypothetical protein
MAMHFLGDFAGGEVCLSAERRREMEMEKRKRKEDLTLSPFLSLNSFFGVCELIFNRDVDRHGKRGDGKRSESE